MKYLFIIIMPCICFSKEFSFFTEDKKIDYWQKVKPTKTKNKIKSEESFEWDTYLNPNNKEFFKEGNYVPPVPFMEVIKNPNDENIKNWFLMIEMKNNLMNRLRENILLYLEKNKNLKEEDRIAIRQESEKSLGPQNQVHSREFVRKYALKLYFDSKCPYSLKMIESVTQLRNVGFYVEFVQIDDSNSGIQNRIPVIQATAQELKLNSITATPVLFIKELNQKTIVRIDGFMSDKEIINKIQNKGLGEL